jgi:2-phosphosulfolactate phosphatase
MRVDVFFTPLGVTPADVTGRPVLVLDILRATTTMVEALANGARAVVPASAPDEAIRIAQQLAPGSRLLAGERRAERIEGFDLGNSPGEMTRAVVEGKTIVMATTNGTPAFAVAEPGRPVYAAAATNFSAVVEAARPAVEAAHGVAILCAGRERMFSLEDAYAAGRFAQALLPQGGRRAARLNDAAVAALELVRHYGDRWKNAIRASAHAGELIRLGFRQDVADASNVDRHALAPLYQDRQVTA